MLIHDAGVWMMTGRFHGSLWWAAATKAEDIEKDRDMKSRHGKLELRL